MSTTRGFSLVEIVVSLFILGIMLLLLHAVIQSSALVKNSKNYGIALSIARDKIESVRAGGYAAVPQNGTFLNTLVSTLPRAATTTLAVSAYNAKTKQVIISIIWLEPSSTASSTISLTTLITETGGLP